MIELHSIAEVKAHLADGRSLADVAVQAVDFTADRGLLRGSLDGTVFLGCRFHDDDACLVTGSRAIVVPAIPDLPYDTHRATLYRADDLLSGYVPRRPETYADTVDGRVYAHYLNTGKSKPATILESLTRRLHDHSITDALHDHVAGRRVVAFMGGHGLPRTDPRYRDVASASRALTERGYTMMSGGGPGAMEATHLGANLAGKDDALLDRVLDRLAPAPTYAPIGPWLDAAFDALSLAPATGEHVGVPTWLYGHEPPTPFAAAIAKYFGNSKREEGLVSLAEHGIVFAPGSAGTVQEIFQDATQNHYRTEAWVSPMVFLDEAYWRDRLPVLPLIRALADGREYADHLHVTDDVDGVVGAISTFTPPGP